LEEALTAIKTFVKEHPEKKWITGIGWPYGIFEGGMPTKDALEKLNKITNNLPVYMDAYDRS